MSVDGPRVCLVLETYWPQVGGGETAGRMLARGLARRGSRVTVLTRRSVPGTSRRERDGEVLVHRLPPSGPGPGKKWALAAPALAAVLGGRGKHDVLAVLGFRVLGAPLVLAGRLLGLPVVLKAESRGEMSGEFFRPGLERRGLRLDSPLVRALLGLRNRALRGAAAIVAMSSEIEAELRAAGVEPSRIHRIPNGVDTDRFVPPDPARRAEARNALGFAGSERVVVYTGRLVAYKGLPELVEIWPAVAAGHPGARLVLVGEGGADQAACENQLRRRIEELGVGSSVRLPGPAKDVLPWLQAADAFVFPSREEAFGLSLVEAMACGLPAVTTRIGGLADIAVPGENALVVPAGEPDALAAALRRLLTGGAEIRALGARARRTAEERFSEHSVVASWHDLLSGLAEAR